MSQVNELASAVEEVLVDEEALQMRIRELGASITEDYRGQDLLLIGVLKGAIFFMADLMRSIEVPCEVVPSWSAQYCWLCGSLLQPHAIICIEVGPHQ